MNTDNHEFNYLPKISYEQFRESVMTNDWVQLSRIIEKSNYERVGLDRLMIIMADIQRKYGRTQGFTFLDIGCNNGFFSNGIAAFGNRVTGLDNYIINIQNIYNLLSLENEVHNQRAIVDLNEADIREYLYDNRNKTWDFVLLLSVAHQWEFGYAHSGENKFSSEEIKETLQRVFNQTKMAIYYECPFEEPGFEYDYGIKFIYRYLENNQEYNIEHVDYTTGSNGYTRRLLRIERRK